jgi:hypothetical protein
MPCINYANHSPHDTQLLLESTNNSGEGLGGKEIKKKESWRRKEASTSKQRPKERRSYKV